MQSFRRHLLTFGLALVLALGGVPAFAGDITYPNLTGAANVQDADLLATWRAAGPLTKVQASVIATYLQGKLGSVFLQDANNLSDLASASTARTNLGLGAAATQSIGTSGVNLCLLNANCTISGAWTFGAKPTLFTSTTAGASENCPNGVAPTSPVTGDIWCASGSVFYYDGATTHTHAWLDSNVATATKLQTARVISLTGDATTTCPSFDGSAAISCATLLAASGVTAASYGSATAVPAITVDAKGRVTAASTNNIPSASTATAGLAPLATAAQTLTGTDTTHAVTPAALGSNCAPASGYCQFPGGWVHMWGLTGSCGAGSDCIVSLPTSCPTVSATVVVVAQATGGTNSIDVKSTTQSQFTIHNNKGSSWPAYFMADCY